MFESCRDRQHPTRYKCNKNRSFRRAGLVGKAEGSLRDDPDFEADQRHIAAGSPALPALWTAAGAASSSLDGNPWRPGQVVSPPVSGFVAGSGPWPVEIEF